MRRLCLCTALAAALALTACVDDSTTPTDPVGDLAPDLLGPSLSIVDGSTGEGGNERFFWLKPIKSGKSGKSSKSGKSGKSGKSQRFTGEPDPDLFPTVVVCERVDQGGGVFDCDDTQTPLVTFERSSEEAASSGKSKKSKKSGKSRKGEITVDKKDHYSVKWSLKDYPPERDGQYRIKVLIGGSELGHADVIVLRKSERRAFRVDPDDELIPISDRGNFTIAFRLEVGVLESQFCDFDGDSDVDDCDAAQEVAGDGKDTQIQVTDEEGGDEVVAVITAPDAVFTDAQGEVIPSVVITAEVEILPPSDDVFTDDEQEIPYFVEVNTFPEDVFIDPEGPGVNVLICQDEEAMEARGIDEPLHPQLILYKVGDNGVTRRLISTLAACAAPSPAPPADGFAAMLRRGASSVLGLVRPQPLVARRRLHGGLNTKITRGGSLDDAFSTFGAVLGPNADSTEAVFPAIGSVGAVVPITIQVGNALGEDFLFGGDTLDVEIFKGPNTGVPVTVVDEGSGLYSATYTPINFGVDSISIVLIRNDGVGLGPIGGTLDGSPYGLEIRCFSPSALPNVTVTLGATCGTPGEVPTFDIAMDVVQPGGTILANAGTHIVENLVVNKPVTIGELGGATAVIQTDTGPRGFLIDGVPSGLVTIQDLDFVNNSGNSAAGRSASVMAKGTYDQVVIQNNTFTNATGPANSGARADTTTVPGAAVLIQNNNFTGGLTGVVVNGVDDDPTWVAADVTVTGNTFSDFVAIAIAFQRAAQGDVTDNDMTECGRTCIGYFSASSGTISGNDVSDCGPRRCIGVFGGNVDVLNNIIIDATPLPADPNAVVFHNAIRFSAGAVGAVNGNIIDRCGWGVCIQVSNGAVAEVRDNVITANELDDTEAGIIGWSDSANPNTTPPTLKVTGNSISAVGNGAGGPGDFDYYGFKINGIMMRTAVADSVSGNIIDNAPLGINAFDGGVISAGVDNVVSNTLAAVNTEIGGFVSMENNDFTDWVISIQDVDGTGTGSVACNWWGGVTGPSNNVLNGGGIVFAPWMDGPIANGGPGSCSGGLSGPITGSGTARIDGTLASQEWQDAEALDVMVDLPGGGQAPARILLMNDAYNLYAALELQHDPAATGISFDVDLDANYDGLLNAGDDRMGGNYYNLASNNQHLNDGGYPWGWDSTDGLGTEDGHAQATQVNGVFSLELSHPLSNLDTRDLKAVVGDIFQIQVRVSMGAAQSTFLGDWGTARPYLVSSFTGGPTGPGEILVSHTTQGQSLPTSPYSVTLSGIGTQTVSQQSGYGTIFSGVPGGQHTYTLNGVPSNCTVLGGNSRVVKLVPESLIIQRFQITCTSIPSNSWSLTSSMAASGRDPASTLLNDGRVLVVGLGTASAQVYHPNSATWTTVPAPFSLGFGIAATKLADGRVLVSGGASAGGSLAAIFDPGSNLFTAVGSLNVGRRYHAQALLPDGRVLVAGGFDGSTFFASIEIFDPGTSTFTLAPVSLSSGRVEPLTALLPSGKLLLAGGSAPSACVLTAELYDPVSNTLSAVPGSMTSCTHDGGSATLRNGRVFLIGNGGTGQLYDPIANAFSPTGASIERRGQFGLAPMADGRVMVIGGFSQTSGQSLASVEIYDPGTGVFTAGPSMIQDRLDHTATLLPDGRILVTGGASLTAGVLSSAEIYYP